MTELRDVVGWFGCYQVSRAGDVVSLSRIVKRKDGKTQCFQRRTLRPMLNNKGYFVVRLSAPGRRRVVPIHRLVADAFIDNPSRCPEVNHLDGVKTNNGVENLEWTTSRGNRKHAWDTGLRRREHLPIHYGEDKPNAKLTRAIVEAAQRAHAGGGSIRGLAREYGVDATTMRRAVHGRSWLPAPPSAPERQE